MEVHLQYFMPDGLGFCWNDWIKPFAHIDSIEDRPRFLAYLIALVDCRLKLLSYENFIWFPPLSVSWILTLVIAPFLLFRAVRNLGLSREAATAALIVYITSAGFLSGFSMIFFPAKALTNALLITSLYLTSRLNLESEGRLLLYEIRSPLKTILFFVIFAGLFVDEGFFFIFIFLPVLFGELFILDLTKPGNLGRAAKNYLSFLIPFFLFLLLVVFIVPMITRHYFDYSFDYLGTLFASRKDQLELGKSFFGRDGEGFGFRSFLDNFMTLSAASFVPWQVSPFLSHRASEGVLSSQAHNKAQIFFLLLLFSGIGTMVFHASGERKKYLVRVSTLCVLYALFMSALIGRHVIFFTGYYYGCTFALFLAVLAAFCYEEIGRGRFKFLPGALIFFMVVVQLNNFMILNRSHVDYHNEVWTKKIFKKYFPVANGKVLTYHELHEIRSAWKECRLEDYLKNNPASSGAIFLLVELRHRDKITHSS